MDCMLSNEDIFDEFIEFCKNADKQEILKQYGGSNIYIPSYKGKHRNDDIVLEYKNLFKKGTPKNAIIRVLAVKYQLSVSSIYNIIKNQKNNSNLTRKAK